jgi:hypothetical protein
MQFYINGANKLPSPIVVGDRIYTILDSVIPFIGLAPKGAVSGRRAYLAAVAKSAPYPALSGVRLTAPGGAAVLITFFSYNKNAVSPSNFCVIVDDVRIATDVDDTRYLYDEPLRVLVERALTDIQDTEHRLDPTGRHAAHRKASTISGEADAAEERRRIEALRRI